MASPMKLFSHCPLGQPCTANRFPIHIPISIVIIPLWYFEIRAGGVVPESYYLKDTIDTSSFESVTIGAGSKLHIKLTIDQPYCVIRYSYIQSNSGVMCDFIFC